MTEAVDSTTHSPCVHPLETNGSPLVRRVGWGLFGAAYLASVVLTLATIQSGTNADLLCGPYGHLEQSGKAGPFYK